MAADSAVSDDDGGITIDAQSKVRRYEHWGLVGEAGDCGLLELATYVFHQETSLRSLVVLMRKVCKDSDGDACWIFVDPDDGKLVVLGSEGSIVKRVEPWEAIGCGSAWAVGALAAGAGPERAVKIACQYNAHCRPPVKVHTQRI